MPRSFALALIVPAIVACGPPPPELSPGVNFEVTGCDDCSIWTPMALGTQVSLRITHTQSLDDSDYVTKLAQLLELAKRGPFRARELDEAEIPRAYLRRLSDRGDVIQIARGVYQAADAPVTELHTVAEVAKRVPQAVICLLTALQIHGLTTEVPYAIWIQIDRKDRAPSFAKPRLAIVRASGPARAHGVDTRTIEGVEVKLTTPAKTVADCFRYRRRVGLDVAIAALRDYLSPAGKRRQRSVDALVDAAKADRIFAVMRPYMEALS
jgi:predicted transcriptional regulator of viral defense system